MPLVTGLNYKKIALGEKIPEKKTAVFEQILKITMAIDKYDLPVSQIHFNGRRESPSDQRRFND